MGKTLLKRMTAMLLCLTFSTTALLSMGTAYAADGDGISAQILLPADWATQSTSIKICIDDGGGVGFSSVQVKVGDRSWKDITSELERQENRCYAAVVIQENSTIYVRVTGHDGQIYENSRYIECFDCMPPTVQGHISGNSLRVECSDDLSGVSEVSISGKSYTYPANGMLNVPLKDIGSGSAQIALQATDRAGNTSQMIQIKNTSYQSSVSKPAANTPAVSSKPAASKSDTEKKPSVSAVPVSDNPPAKDDPTKPLTPDGQGTVVDNVTDEDSKEFFTIATQNDNTFYLVIDKQRDSENVYLLDTVKESDLLSMAEKDAEQPSQSAIPEPEPVCDCKEKCVAGEVDTDCPVCTLSLKDCTGKEPEPVNDKEIDPKESEKGNIGTLILAALVAVAAGGIGWYFKIYKPKKDLDDAEDFDDLIDDEEEEMVNEDDEPEPEHKPYGEPDEPDYPDDYYEDPGDEP